MGVGEFVEVLSVRKVYRGYMVNPTDWTLLVVKFLDSYFLCP